MSRCSLIGSLPSMARLVLLASMPRMRSESRTLETSGLVTMRASSAKCMAINAPVSIPAGESQTMYSNSMSARSFKTFSTPSCVNASLSRVCEAASTNRLGTCLSLISAWFSVASPWITLIRSYTTRRSQPMMRSRLRRPTSKSMTAVLWPASARPDEKLALVVVLPTPPLPEVTTMILAMGVRSSAGFEWVHHQPAVGAALQADLGRLAQHLGGQRHVARAVHAGDGDEFGFEAQRDDAGLGVAARAGHGLAAQRCVDVDAAVGDHFGAGVHHRHHDQVATARIHLLARPQRPVDDQ